jgi:4-amino-4-deoxy-L-arabinose transferase-like glycosyltransferase
VTVAIRPDAETARARRRSALLCASVLLFAFVLFFGSWKDEASMSGDPIVYAEIGREIVERGDPTRLTLDDRPAAKKPPLVFWMEAAAFSVLGFREWVARLPSAAMGVACVALAFAWTRRRHGRRVAFGAAVACLAFPVFQRTAHQARLDTTLAFFSTAALLAYARAARLGPTLARAAGVGALLGLAVLAKGPAGLLPLGAIVAGSLLARRGRVLARTLPALLASLLLVAGSWYALQLAREGSAWWGQLHDDWTRDSAPVQGLAQAVAFYATDVLLPGAVWVVAFGFGARLALRRLRRSPERALPEALLLSFVAVFLLSLPALPMHYGRYVAQVVPALAIVGAPWIAWLVRRVAGARPRLRVERALAAGLLAAALVGYPVYVALDRASPLAKYEDLARASDALAAAAPGTRDLPPWASSMDERGRDAISLPTAAAARFYYGTRLVPFRPGDATQAPLVLFLHGSGGPAETAAFDATHRFEVVRRSERATLYRTR